VWINDDSRLCEVGADVAEENRIIVTVGAWDIPQTWWDQLAPGGRLVLPLRWRGTTRAVAFTKRDHHWKSDWVFLCGFVPMLGQPGEQKASIDPDGLVALHYDMDQPIDIDALQGVLEREKSVVWSDATVHGEEPFDRIWLHLSAVDDGTVRVETDRRAVASGLCTPAIASRSPALAEGGSLAYFTIRRTSTPGRWQLGAIGHGPLGHQLAARIVDHETSGTGTVPPIPTPTPHGSSSWQGRCVFSRLVGGLRFAAGELRFEKSRRRGGGGRRGAGLLSG
jgi:protein-L-isoaspartate(D-aspartate) O-methyltransferase